MSFDQILNRIRISGLKKLLAAIIALIIVLTAYAAAFIYRSQRNVALYSDFINTYNTNNSQAAAYLDAETKEALYGKPTGEAQAVVQAALAQSVQKFSTLQMPDTADASDQQALEVEHLTAASVIPLFYKELNTADSKVRNSVKQILQSPADVTAYNELKKELGACLSAGNGNLEKVKESMQLQKVPASGLSLPGLRSEKIQLSLTAVAVLQAHVKQALQEEGEHFTDLLNKIAGSTESLNEQAQTSTDKKPEETTAKVTETVAASKAKTTTAAPKKTDKPKPSTKPGKTQPVVSGTKKFVPRKVPNNLVQNSSSPKADSKVPTVGKYYAVKISDNIYAIAQSAYAGEYDNFAVNPDYYIDLIISANKLTVRKNVVYLRDKQVIYIPRP